MAESSSGTKLHRANMEPTDHAKEEDPLPPGWSEDAGVVKEERGRKKLEYTTVYLKYDPEIYGQQADCTIQDKQGEAYQEHLVSIQARLLSAHSKAFVSEYEAPVQTERAAEVLAEAGNLGGPRLTPATD